MMINFGFQTMRSCQIWVHIIEGLMNLQSSRAGNAKWSPGPAWQSCSCVVGPNYYVITYMSSRGTPGPCYVVCSRTYLHKISEAICTQFFWLFLRTYLDHQEGILVFQTQNHHDKKRLLLGGRNHKQQYSYQTNGTALSVMVLRAMSIKESHNI